MNKFYLKLTKNNRLILIITAMLLVLALSALVYALFILPSIAEDIYSEKKRQTREMVDIGLSILEHFYYLEAEGSLSRDEAQREAAELVGTLRYGDPDLDYFWINDLDSVMIVHPMRPDLVGKPIIGSDDPDDIYLHSLFQLFIDMAKEQGAGHVDYSWQYYDEINRFEEKLSYVALFEPWDWIIGTGVYLSDLDVLIAQRRNTALALLIIFSAAVAAGAYFYMKKKMVEGELLQSEEKYRLIAENTADAITVLDLELKYVYISPSIQKLHGYSVEEAMNRTLAQTLTPESLNLAIQTFADEMALINEGKSDFNKTMLLELEEYKKDGSTIWVENSLSFIRNHQGKPVGILSVAKDITERKRQGEELEKAKEKLKTLNEELENRVCERTSELEAANKELAAFSYSVSHDLRSPLRSICGFSEAVLEDHSECLDDQGRDYLERVVKAGRRMAELIDDLLKLSRVTRQELNRDMVDLSSIVRAYLIHLSEIHPQRRVIYTVAEGCFVPGDAALLRIAMENLIDNAWKYSKFSNPARIDFGFDKSDGNIICYVRDNGVGFDMSCSIKIFNAFERLHNTEHYPGSGVGLSIVQRIIERHGGSIWAESAEGVGAVFYISLS
jgi:PAS domain S-box-containing protein